MPRNVEAKLSIAIDENKFELFIFIFAIQSGIIVPQEILLKFGTSWGTEENHHNIEFLENKRNELAVFIKLKEETMTFFDVEIMEKINSKYRFDSALYEMHQKSCLQNIKNLNFIKEKVTLLKTLNNLQSRFKNKILKYINSEISKGEKQLNELIKPTKMDYQIFINTEYNKLKRQVKETEKELLTDPAFCKSIVNDWLDNHNR